MAALRADPQPVTAAAQVADKPTTTSTHDGAASTDKTKEGATSVTDPPLPGEDAPPLPNETAPYQQDDGWTSERDPATGVFYFYNYKTGVSQWENPRVRQVNAYSHAPHYRNPTGDAASSTSSTAPGTVPITPGTSSVAPGTVPIAPGTSSPPKRLWGGYNPAIHGSYDPNADYAREASKEEEEQEQAAAAAAAAATAAAASLTGANGYSAQAHFNRFTGKFQQAGTGPELHNDENKSKRQMTAFFDVDAAANSHDGRSLKAERRGKTLTKKELKAFKEKRHNKKEEKRRAWLRD